MEPMSLAVEVWSFNHWAAREFPCVFSEVWIDRQWSSFYWKHLSKKITQKAQEEFKKRLTNIKHTQDRITVSRGKGGVDLTLKSLIKNSRDWWRLRSHTHWHVCNCTAWRRAGHRLGLDNGFFLQQRLLLCGAQFSSQTIQVFQVRDLLGVLSTVGNGQHMASRAGYFLDEADGTWVTAKVWVRREKTCIKLSAPEVGNSLLWPDSSGLHLPSNLEFYRNIRQNSTLMDKAYK